MAMTFKIYIVYSERWNHIGNMVHGSMTDLGRINKTDYKRKFTLLFSQIISIKECTLKSTPDSVNLSSESSQRDGILFSSGLCEAYFIAVMPRSTLVAVERNLEP